MDVEVNPRPNHKLERCCGTCIFFLFRRDGAGKGHCILPEVPKDFSNVTKVTLRERIEEFAHTYAFCSCENHQWKPRGGIKHYLKWSEVKSP